MNTVNIIGTLGRDADARAVGDYTVFDFSVAVNGAGDKKQEGSDFYESGWFKVKYWTKNPERFAESLAKGSSVAVSGKLKEAKWEKDGATVTMVYIKADTLASVVRNKGGAGGSTAAPAAGTSAGSSEFDPFAD